MMAWSRQRGTYGELAPAIEQAATDLPEYARMLASTLAVAHVEAGRIDDACRLLEEAAGADFDTPLDFGWLVTMVNYAEVAIACRHPKCAGVLFDRLAPWADQAPFGGLTVDSPVSHFLGGLATVLGRYDDADTYFAHAAALNDRANAKFFAARTNLSWGAMLAERHAPGDAERARDLLTKAHAAAAAHGYANVERRAAEALEHLD
jgi:tetratricopeptide (TPR) repeat protein